MDNANITDIGTPNDWMHWIAEFQRTFRPGMTTYQLENFVVGRGGETPFGRWRQAQRELFGRIAGLQPNSQITQIQAEDILTCLGLVLAYRRQFDEPTEELEIAEWVAVARVEAGCEMLAHGRVSVGTWKLLRALPPVAFRQIAEEIKSDPDALVQTFLEERQPLLDPVRITQAEFIPAIESIIRETRAIGSDQCSSATR